MRALFVSLLFVGAVAGCEPSGPAGAVFIAQQVDFAPYAGWEKFSLGVAMNSGHPVGPQFGFRNMGPVGGAYPIGAILVKEIDVGELPQQWELFGMAKRGGGYNAGGAKEWEFFTLSLNDARVPIIVSRGSNPSDSDSQGHGYAGSANGVTCNRCHGAVGMETTDYVLDPFMMP